MEFVRIRYPGNRQVLVDNSTLRPTNQTFRVDRGTHSFAIDEPADPPEIIEFIELTAQQSPRELVFQPLADLGLSRGAQRSISPPRMTASPTATKKAAAPERPKRKSRKAAAGRKTSSETKPKPPARPKAPKKKRKLRR